jgi:hypothetical protein
MVRACESLEGGASDERRLIDDANYAIASRGRRERQIGLARPVRDGDWVAQAAFFALRHGSRREAEQSMPSQDVVGETEPVQHGGHLPLSANGELLETPLPEAGVDAFGHHSTFIDTFAVRAAHAAPPLGNAGTVIVARGIGVGPMLALRRRSIDLDALACGPFRVAVVVDRHQPDAAWAVGRNRAGVRQASAA